MEPAFHEVCLEAALCRLHGLEMFGNRGVLSYP
jgi:hypothetical protein